jgi:hypothetical protein
MKTIYHVGGWSRNYGDLSLQAGQMRVLQEDSDAPLRFVPVHCQQTWFHPDLIEKINDEADLLLVGGGGLIFHRPEDNSHSGWQFDVRLEDLEKIRVPLAVYAIGYNRFYFDGVGFAPIMERHLRAVQDRAILFGVRNRGTRDAVIGHGLDPARVELLPDPGLYVPPSRLELDCLKDQPLKIGLNWAGDRPHFRFAEPWEANRELFIDTLCSALHRLLDAAGGGRVVFVPHLQENIDSEVYPLFAERLGERIVNLEHVAPHIYPPSATQAAFLADVYRQMDLVLGMRGHATIVPFGVGTPVLGMGSHNKVKFFLSDVGLGHRLIDTQTRPDGGGVDAIYRQMAEVLAARDAERRHIAERATVCRAATRDFHRRLFERMESAHAPERTAVPVRLPLPPMYRRILPSSGGLAAGGRLRLR